MIKVSKIDAARRQLETAISIYFSSGDPVSIHTLAAAAYNVLRDIGAKRGRPPMFVKDQLVATALPEKQAELRGLLNEAENFFKHADRDHEEVLDFSPKLTEFFLMDAAREYYRLTQESPPTFKAFDAWMMVSHPDLFVFSDESRAQLKRTQSEIVSMGRAAFLKEYLPLALSMRI